MKAVSIVLILSLVLTACAQPMTICGTTYDSYGLMNQDDKKNPDIQYEIVWGNVIWSAILIETFIFPIYFFGFSLFQPVGLKSPVKGAIGQPQTCPGKQAAVSPSKRTD